MPIATFLIAASVAAAAPGFKTLEPIQMGGEARWDYVQMDSAAHRLYVSHGMQTEVIDTETRRVIGTIPNTLGVHGIAIASELGLGYTSNGQDNSVTVFELATLATRARIKVGQNPDAILYVPGQRLLITFNGRSKDLSVIDAVKGELIKTVPVGGKPEFAQLSSTGQVLFNIEDRNELASIDPKTLTLGTRQPLKSCDEPTGLAVDEQARSYSVCGSKVMVIVTPDGRQQSVPIGGGADGVAWMDGQALSANGADGTLTIVQETAPGQFAAIATVPTARGARTIAADPLTHRIYLPTADFEPAQGQERPKGKPGSFRILVLERQ